MSVTHYIQNLRAEEKHDPPHVMLWVETHVWALCRSQAQMLTTAVTIHIRLPSERVCKQHS